MILDTTDNALIDAGYDRKPYDKTRVGVVAGTIFGTDFCDQLQMGFRLPDFCDKLGEVLRGRGVADDQIMGICRAYEDALLKHMPALLDQTGGFTPSTLASRITKTYDFMGGAATIDAGQASSLAALCSAVDLLDGSCDMVLCAAGHRAMGLPMYELLALDGSLSGDDPKSPFDVAASGYLPGEGVGVVVLKRLADAERDGDRVRGIIRGIGASVSSSCRQAVDQALERAYQAAGVVPDEVALLQTSGVGRCETDDQEIAAVADRMATATRREPLRLGSVVGQIGHTQGASGMASLLAAMQSLDKLEVPAVFGATAPNAALAAEDSRIRLATTASQLTAVGSRQTLLAGATSTDSLGAAYHLVLERGTRMPADETAHAGASQLPGEQVDSNTRIPHAAKTATAPCESTVQVTVAAPTGWRIVRIGAASMAELQSRMAKADCAAELFATADSLKFRPADRWRLATVASDADDLAQKLTLAAQSVGTPQAVLLARKDVFLGKATQPPGKVAFLFSGQGSQYAGMLKPLVEEFPPAAETMRQIDAVLRRLHMPTFAEIAWEHPEALGKDVWITQLSLLCADMIVFQSLQALGMQPDYVAGHSYGEFPALAAAGAWDFENVALATRARCQAIESCRKLRGRMLSAAAAGPVVEKICRQIEGHVYPANYNAPDQTVVGGDEDAIAQLAERLKAEGITAMVLPVPRPFHTPLMHDVQEPLAHGLEPICIHAPRVPMLSGVANRFVSSPEEIRANLVAQMTAPVRYVDLIEQLAGLGVQAMVEAGPREVLTGLHAKILAGRDVAILPCDDKTRSGISRLLAVQACLETRGLLDRPTASPTVDVFAPIREIADVAPLAPAAKLTSDSTPATPYEIGRQQGVARAEQIRLIARRYADAAGFEPKQPREDRGPNRDWTDALSEKQREELRGIAEEAGVSAEALAAYNAWCDSADERAAIRPPWGNLPTIQAIHVSQPADGSARIAVAGPRLDGAAAGGKRAWAGRRQLCGFAPAANRPGTFAAGRCQTKRPIYSDRGVSRRQPLGRRPAALRQRRACLFSLRAADASHACAGDRSLAARA